MPKSNYSRTYATPLGWGCCDNHLATWPSLFTAFAAPSNSSDMLNLIFLSLR